MTTTYELSPNIRLNVDYGVNTTGMSVWHWNVDNGDEHGYWQTLFDKRMSGYCLFCGSMRALSEAGYDDPFDLIVDTDISTIDCQCD